MPPKEAPRLFRPSFSEVKFDPSVHLQMEPPKVVRTLDFEDVPFPYPKGMMSDDGTAAFDFAYTPKPFRLLSDDGVKALREIIDTHKPGHLKQNERNNTIRGLGYLSHFVRDLTYDPSITQLLSSMAKTDLHPHDSVMNHAHTNIGNVGTGKAVDQWHVDAVDFVCIILVSDTRGMKGGELKVLQLSDATKGVFDDLKAFGIPQELVESVQAPPIGHAIFMRGSKLLHSVSPVAEGVEPRYSVVQSYTTRNVFAPDLTRLGPFREQFGDPKEIADLEFARHKAWRVAGQLKYVMDNLSFGTETDEVVELFQSAAKELVASCRLLKGEISDIPGYLVQEDDFVTKDVRERADHHA